VIGQVDSILSQLPVGGELPEKETTKDLAEEPNQTSPG
jgi:hypothetical protein